MPEQLGLFAQRAPRTCPRFPGYALCGDARARADGCPGAKACEEWPSRTDGLTVRGIHEQVEKAKAGPRENA